MLRQMYSEQLASPLKGDWSNQVKSDMEDLNIKEEDFATLTKWQFKKLVNLKSRSKAFENLEGKIKTKGAQNNYSTLQIEDYLTSRSVLNWNEKLTALKIRTGMIKIASNFPGRFGNDDKCQLGCDKFENLEHILINCNKVEEKVEESLVTDSESLCVLFIQLLPLRSNTQ